MAAPDFRLPVGAVSSKFELVRCAGVLCADSSVTAELSPTVPIRFLKPFRNRDHRQTVRDGRLHNLSSLDSRVGSA